MYLKERMNILFQWCVDIGDVLHPKWIWNYFKSQIEKMEVIAENLWHLWVEKQCYEQCPCPLQCTNNLLVLFKVSCSCWLAKPVQWAVIFSECKSNNKVWNVLFSFSILTEWEKKHFLHLSKTFAEYDISCHLYCLESWYQNTIWSFPVFCCCSEISKQYAAWLSWWTNICTDLDMANTILLMLLCYLVYRLAGEKILASGYLPSVPYRPENGWGTSTGASMHM